ncbi:ABC transporter substrate-binding protein [Sediminibacillus massiliensis]|uniref:ABC transporter substrate-binding protein n=1 Tax=Sediminibacillus massiliensis TaxID=1926277 RepID=UPI0009884EB0|nr:sugar ABC transporter substrate-binding protein [Sediminibacillus massiliensis]
MKFSKFMFLMTLSILSILIIGGCSSESSSDSGGSAQGADGEEEIKLRFSWWGDTSRNEIYNEIIDRFEEENPNITVDREFGGWTDYWDRLATQTAGGNAPDIVSMHQFYVSDYARRGALLNLQSLVDDGTINLESFAESTVDSGKVDDELIMVAKGVTMPGWVYNPVQLEELGVEAPNFDWTWEEFQAKMLEVDKAMPEGDFATADMGGGQLQPNFRYYVRQQGEDLFTEDGKLGFSEETLSKWWTMWDDLRQAGAVADSATTTEFESAALEQKLFTIGRSAFYQIPANQLHLYQEQFENGELQMLRMPQVEGGENGEYIEGAYLSITKESEHPEAAAKFIDFFVNTEKSLELFKVEQGSPGSSEMAEFVKPLLEPAQQRAVDYIQETVEYAEPAAYAPLGISEVEQAFADNAAAIGFGEKTVEEAVTDFMETAESVIGFAE